MKTPVISMIAAIDEERGIGRDNKLLWHIPADMKRFRQLTAGHPVIMGRKTFQSIGRPLPNRLNIVITRDPQFAAQGVTVVGSLYEALQLAEDEDNQEIFIIGGGEIYRQGMNVADKLYLTVVRGTHGADTFFPGYSAFRTERYRETGADNGHEFTFLELAR